MLIRMKLRELREEEREEIDHVELDRIIGEILNAPPPTRERLENIEHERRRRLRKSED